MTTWGTTEWGGIPESVIADTLGNNAPSVTKRSPAPDATGVSPYTPLEIVFFDVDGDIDLTTVYVEINGASVELTLDGDTPGGGGGGGEGFPGNGPPLLTPTGADYIGEYVTKFFRASGRVILNIAKLGGWDENSSVTVYAYAEDAQSNSGESQWTFSTGAVLENYEGSTPLAVEKQLLQPFPTYLNIDVVRSELVRNALVGRNIGTSDYQASRVIYQLAHLTEIKTVLNPYRVVNREALTTRVSQRARTLNIDKKLVKSRPVIRRGIRDLKEAGVLTEAQAVTMYDYLDSTSYLYRVSLAAVITLLAAYVENA